MFDSAGPVLDASQIQSTEVTTQIPSTFGQEWSQAIGGTTQRVEEYLGEAYNTTVTDLSELPTDVSNSVQSTWQAVTDAPVSVEATLGNAVQAVEDKTSSVISSVKASTVGVLQGTVSLVHWLVIGLVAAALIYLASTARMLKI